MEPTVSSILHVTNPCKGQLIILFVQLDAYFLFVKQIEHAGRWNLEKQGVYNPLSGLTNNQSEGFNSILKRMQSWKEIPIDTALLSLYHLQVYYRNEWQRRLAGINSSETAVSVVIDILFVRIG